MSDTDKKSKPACGDDLKDEAWKEEFPGMLVVVEGGKIVAKQRVKHVNDQHIILDVFELKDKALAHARVQGLQADPKAMYAFEDQVYDDNTAEVRHNINLKITNIKAQLESASRSAAAGAASPLSQSMARLMLQSITELEQQHRELQQDLQKLESKEAAEQARRKKRDNKLLEDEKASMERKPATKPQRTTFSRPFDDAADVEKLLAEYEVYARAAAASLEPRSCGSIEVDGSNCDGDDSEGPGDGGGFD